jgi:hypothetical protein
MEAGLRLSTAPKVPKLSIVALKAPRKANNTFSNNFDFLTSGSIHLAYRHGSSKLE